MIRSRLDFLIGRYSSSQIKSVFSETLSSAFFKELIFFALVNSIFRKPRANPSLKVFLIRSIPGCRRQRFALRFVPPFPILHLAIPAAILNSLAPGALLERRELKPAAIARLRQHSGPCVAVVAMRLALPTGHQNHHLRRVSICRPCVSHHLCVLLFMHLEELAHHL